MIVSDSFTGADRSAASELTTYQMRLFSNGIRPPTICPFVHDLALIQSTIWDVVSKQESAYTGVPEPSCMILAGMGGLVLLRRRAA